jgi:hypothetical protein
MEITEENLGIHSKVNIVPRANKLESWFEFQLSCPKIEAFLSPLPKSSLT